MDDEATLKRKLKLTSQLVEILEARVDANDKITNQQTEALTAKDREIIRLEEALHRERNRPVPITQSIGQSRRVDDLDYSEINAAALLIEVERLKIRW